MEPVKILIVEDQRIVAKTMRMSLEKRGYVVTGAVGSGAEALESIPLNQPDLILMDIHLKGKIDGISTARSIARNYAIPVIYITQLKDDEVFRSAKETFPKNYIEKPFNDDTLFNAIELAIQNLESPLNKTPIDQANYKVADGVFIRTSKNEHKKLLFEDILFFQSSKVYTNIFFEKRGQEDIGMYKISFSSNHVLEQLDHPAIIRVHKSYYVNVNKIDSFQSSELDIRGRSIPVSNKYKNEIEQKLMILRSPSRSKKVS